MTTNKLTDELVEDSELQMLIDSHEKGTTMFMRVDSYYLMAKELQEHRAAVEDKDLLGVIDALEHPAGINAAGKQVVRRALVELQEIRRSYLALRGEIEDVQSQLYEADNQANEYAAELQERRKADSQAQATLNRLAVILHGSEVDLNLLTVTAQSLMDRCKAANSPVAPDGWVMVPMRLTAENGAKGLLSGEFSETTFINCPECFGDDECETCDGSGRIEITVPVTWTTIKEIWAKGIEHFAAAPKQENVCHLMG